MNIVKPEDLTKEQLDEMYSEGTLQRLEGDYKAIQIYQGQRIEELEQSFDRLHKQLHEAEQTIKKFMAKSVTKW